MWSDLEWLRANSDLPVLVKGILNPADAKIAVKEGLDGIVVSNHGGRELDTVPAAITALPKVVDAVENRIPLVRCANNGLTCWVDPVGAMHDVYFPDDKNIYKAGFKISEVPVLGEGESRTLTIYTRYGDVFGWSCFGFVAANVMAIYIRRGLKRKTPVTVT